ncbi:hypothetical protein V8C26DRAFT_251689 [Trichoderma gracile]
MLPFFCGLVIDKQPRWDVDVCQKKFSVQEPFTPPSISLQKLLPICQLLSQGLSLFSVSHGCHWYLDEARAGKKTSPVCHQILYVTGGGVFFPPLARLLLDKR